MEEEKQKSIFTEGLILGALTIWGYLAAYCLDKGMNDYYGIPSYFTDLSLTSVLGNITTLLLTGFFLHFFVWPAIKSYIFSPKHLVREINYLTAFLAVLALGVVRDRYTLLAIIALWVFLTIKAIYEHKKRKKNPSSISPNTNQLGNWGKAFSILGLGILSLYWMTGVGELFAKLENEYLVISQGNERMVVLGTYNDFFITAPVDLEKKIIKNKFKLVENKAAGEIQKIKTGVLAVEDPMDWPKENKQEDLSSKIQNPPPKSE